ncbi:hypothetical protein F66182_18031, partial [Fusarium sp. NRRL 66182]
MGLTTEEIVAVTILGLFYVILLGRYAIRFLEWCSGEERTAATDIEAQNGTENTENTATKGPSSSKNQSPSSFLREETTEIEAQINTTPRPTTK